MKSKNLTPEQRAEIARRNGAKSHGPTSEEGKAKSSRNAVKHGLAAEKHVVLDCEDNQQFLALRDAYLARFNPADDIERFHVLQMANMTWRMMRLQIAETAEIDLSLDSARKEANQRYNGIETPHVLAIALRHAYHDGDLDNIHVYELRASRLYDRAFRNLQRLQKDRVQQKTNEPASPVELEPEPEPKPGPQSAPLREPEAEAAPPAEKPESATPSTDSLEPANSSTTNEPAGCSQISAAPSPHDTPDLLTSPEIFLQ